MAPRPIILLGDSPTATSGLGRVVRDLATRIVEHTPETYRVCTLGYGGAGSRHLPFQQYAISDVKDWIVKELPQVYEDFCGDERGIVMGVWDPTRLLWLADPKKYCPDSEPRLKQFCLARNFDLWNYGAIDAEGPNGKLSILFKDSLAGFDRVLAYSDWAKGLVEKTLDDVDWTNRKKPSIDFLPHGIDTTVFKPRNRRQARRWFGHKLFGGPCSFGDDHLVIAINATNQARKDFGTAAMALAELAKVRDVRIWIHTDVMDRYWSLPELLMDYNLHQRTVITSGALGISDEQLSWGYSATDVCWSIGLGEGFGFCAGEALACGTPCLGINYSGHAEWLPEKYKIEPIAFRPDAGFSSMRPVTLPQEWVDATLRVAGESATLPTELDWNGSTLWPRWQSWLENGKEQTETC